MIEGKKVRTSLISANNKVVFKVKKGRKIQAVNRNGGKVMVDATSKQISAAGLPQRVQSKDRKKAGYKARGHESRALRRGKASSKKQPVKSLMNEVEGMRKYWKNSIKRIK